MDETSVAYYYGHQYGIVYTGGRGVRHSKGTAKASRRDLRSAITYLPLVTDSIDVQRFLPHFIIGNEAILLKRDETEINDQKPPHFHITRQKSGCNNSFLTAEYIIPTLGRALQRHAPDVTAILQLDTARCHIHARVFRAALRWNTFLRFHPSGFDASVTASGFPYLPTIQACCERPSSNKTKPCCSWTR